MERDKQLSEGGVQARDHTGSAGEQTDRGTGGGRWEAADTEAWPVQWLLPPRMEALCSSGCGRGDRAGREAGRPQPGPRLPAGRRILGAMREDRDVAAAQVTSSQILILRPDRKRTKVQN